LRIKKDTKTPTNNKPKPIIAQGIMAVKRSVIAAVVEVNSVAMFGKKLNIGLIYYCE
jgi:hypothetical protein